MFDANTRFSQLPSTPIQRSRWTQTVKHDTTFNFGTLVPFYWRYCLPGETVSLDANVLARMSTPIYPVMGNAYIDVAFFAVPMRLLWEHWEEFNGASPDNPWYQPIDYTIPQMTIPSGGFAKGTLMDHLGFPVGVKDNAGTETVSNILPRCYAKIWNDWWRDENIDNPTYFTKQDATLTGSNTGSAVYGGKLCKVNKFHDLFTSALPSPQKAAGPVTFGLTGFAPVDAGADHTVNNTLVRFGEIGGGVGTSYHTLLARDYGIGDDQDKAHLMADSATASGVSSAVDVKPINLVADLASAGSISVNDLRLAVATQRIYESMARAGSRYVELLQSLYHVQPMDARLQRSEYIGGKRFPIGMQQVVQTSETSTEQLGTTGAYSLTNTGRNSYFTYSTTEHMVIMGVLCARTRHTYQQGINKWWSKKDRFSFYWPQFANIGEQPILKKELYFDGSAGAKNDDAFAYQEAWYEYRFSVDSVTGDFRSTGTPGLDSWLYVDYYSSAPSLSEGWLGEGVENVDRTISVQSSVHDQMIADIAVHQTIVAPMPLYSVPGMMDHF